MEKTVKQTRGTVGERQIAFVAALKAVKPDNNDVEPVNNAD